jgi:hypothetical protein
MKPIGRPHKLNPKTLNEIVAAVQVGATLKLACEYAGISYGTFAMWQRRAEAEMERLEKSRAELFAYVEGLPPWKPPTNPPRAVPANRRRRKLQKPFEVPHDLIVAARPQPKEKPYLHFFKAIKEARAVAGIGWLKVIDTVSNHDPVWAEKQLMRMGMAGEAQPQKIELTTPPDAPIQVQHSGEVKVVPDVDRIADILGVLASVGALQSRDIGSTGAADDAEADEIHPDNPQS